jgi:chemotaxis protein methyltransferase CheR
MSDSPELSDADFERLREFFYRRTGIQFSSSKRYFVDKRVAACIEESGSDGFATWFARIRLGGEEHLVRRLISRMTVNETYFLRESYQLDCLVGSVLPRVLADGGGDGTVRILSIPCSTGDEPYSIAITLLERWPAIDDVDVQITGVDIDADVVAVARAGVFGARALQHLSDGLRARYFERTGEGHRIRADLRQVIGFDVGNITDAHDMRRFRGYDVIFCRNLLIYFDELSSRRAAENLYAALRPGGYLFLGHSESMSRISPIFTPVRMREALVYRRPETEE